MEKIKVKLQNGTEVEVSKLPLKRYADLFTKLDKFPIYLNELDGSNNEDIFLKLPSLIVTALPDFCNLVEVATGFPADEVEELGLDEVVDLVLAVWEVNNFSDIFTKIKKVKAQGQPKSK